MKTTWALSAAICLAAPSVARAAIGCTLSNPAEDLKYLLPTMTSYKEDLKEFSQLKDGKELFRTVASRLGSALDPIYETFDTPYTVYSVYRNKEKIGVVHGVNVPGKGGVIQIFLSVDPQTAAIRKFFFQRLESPAAAALRDKSFRAQFEGLTLADFYKHDYYAAAAPTAPADKIASLKPPNVAPAGGDDYAATIRGIRKDLVLLDLFVFGRRFDPFYEKASAAAAGRKKP